MKISLIFCLKKAINLCYAQFILITVTFTEVRSQNASEYSNNIPISGGNDCAAFGYNALFSNTGGSTNYNCGLGKEALYNNTGSELTALGKESLWNNLSVADNTAVGNMALYSNDYGTQNTAFGAEALFTNDASGSGGNFNTAIGYQALSIRPNNNNNSAFGSYADVNANNRTNSTAIGSNAIAGSNNSVKAGDGFVTRVMGQVVVTVSDGRFKENIRESDVKGMDFIRRLQPILYTFNPALYTRHITQKMPPEKQKIYNRRNFDVSKAIRRSGFLAQEVEMAAKETKYDFDAIKIPQDEADTYGLSYGLFVVPLVKAVQEQQATIESIREQLNNQSKTISTYLQKSIIHKSNSIVGYIFVKDQKIEINKLIELQYALTTLPDETYLYIYSHSGKQLLKFPLRDPISSVTINSGILNSENCYASINSKGKIIVSKNITILK